MRVAHVIKVVRIAGAEQHLLTLLDGLRARQIDAQLILLVEPSNPMEAYVQAASARGIPVTSVVINSHFDLTLHQRLWKLFKSLKPDIVHTHLVHGDLFGIPAATNTATSRITKMTRALVLPYFFERLPGGGYRGVIHPPLDDFPTDDPVADTERFNRIVEAEVRRIPAQYLWIHRRFKGLTPDYPDYYAHG